MIHLLLMFRALFVWSSRSHVLRLTFLLGISQISQQTRHIPRNSSQIKNNNNVSVCAYNAHTYANIHSWVFIIYNTETCVRRGRRSYHRNILLQTPASFTLIREILLSEHFTATRTRIDITFFAKFSH